MSVAALPGRHRDGRPGVAIPVIFREARASAGSGAPTRRLRGWVRVVGALLALASLAAACSSSGGRTAGRPTVLPAPRLEPGAAVHGLLRPGETVTYPLTLRQGEYLEVYLDQPLDRARLFLLAPGQAEATGYDDAYGSGEFSAHPPAQVLWEVAETGGAYRLRLESLDGKASVRYRLTVGAAHPATERDWSRHRGVQLYFQAAKAQDEHEFEKALSLYREALELCEKGGYVRGTGSSYHSIGEVLQELGHKEEALASFEEARARWARLGETDSEVEETAWIAQAEMKLLRLDDAQRRLDEALVVARRLSSRVPEADVLDQICQLDHARGFAKEAIETCKQAVDLWRALGKPRQSTDSLNNLGLMYRDLGETAMARKYFREALAIFDRYPKPEKRATLLNNLGLLAEADGEYGDALSLYHQALEANEAADRWSHSGVNLYNIGRMQERLGDDDAALRYLLRAQDRLEQAGDVLWRIQVLQALGGHYAKRGELGRAREVLDHALTLSRDAHAMPQTAGCLDQIGDLRLVEERPGEALGPLEEALTLHRKMGDRWAEARVLAELARAHLLLGRDDGALEELRRAETLNDELGNRSALASNRYETARIERARGELGEARKSIEGALELVDAMRPEVGGEELRALFAATKQPYYDFYIDLLMTEDARDPGAGHAAEALRESEHARARSLLETLAEAHLDLDDDAPAELREQKAEIEHRLDAKELQRQQLVEPRAHIDDSQRLPASERSRSDTLFQVELDLERLLTQLRDVESRIRAASPRYAALTEPRSLSVEEIQSSLLDDRTTLLEYSLGAERSFLWAVTSDRLESFELPGQAELEGEARCLHWLLTSYQAPPVGDRLTEEGARCLGERLDAYRRAAGASAFEAPPARRARIREAFAETADRLSDQILGGAAKAGLLRPRLAVVSDGALQYVPLAALPDPASRGDRRPLVLGHELVRLPSASVLAFQRDRNEREAEARGEVAIIADPVYSPSDSRLDGALAASAGPGEGEAVRGRPSAEEPPLPEFHRLPFAGQEARAIAGFADPAETFEAEGLAASRETVMSGRLEGYRYVHFATHGVIDTSRPQLSGLVLSLVDDAGNPRADDGFLRLHDIYRLRLDAEVVVLSACDTALGREVRGEGLVGLTRGFMYAGARRVVASLWEVQDLATARLMERFYRGLIEGRLAPADALRQAQIEIMSDPDQALDFPYYWAGFVLQGDWR